MRGLGFALCEPNFHCEVGELRSELERPSSIPTIALMGEAPVALMDTPYSCTPARSEPGRA